MTDENSPQGAGDKDQDLDMERTVVEASVPGDVRADGLDGPPPTGDPRVDDAVAGLRRLPGSPAEEHVAVLEEVHGRLRDILDDLGPGQARPGHAPTGGSGVVPPGQQ